jgi:nitrate/nitrite-specific signal transduction histidine kinase
MNFGGQTSGAISNPVYLKKLHKHLQQTTGWQETIAELLEIPYLALSASRTLITSHHIASGEKHLIGNKTKNSISVFEPGYYPAIEEFPCCLPIEVVEHGSLTLCPCREDDANEQYLSHWFIPMSEDGEHVYVLHMFSDRLASEEDDYQQLEAAAPILSRAFENRILKHKLHELHKALKYEKTRMARHLHDTIAHDLAYLRLKLDMLSNASLADQTLEDSGKEIQFLCDIANGCYDQVRGYLTNLVEGEEINPASPLLESVSALQEASDANIHWYVRGQPGPLPAAVNRTVIYILRELIRNVEKYAQASKTEVSLAWEEDRIYVVVSDNGIGFDVHEALNQRGHFGLKIIRDYVHENQGEIKILSSSESGTQVSFWIPTHTAP